MKRRLLIPMLSFLIVGICSGKSPAAEYVFGKSVLATSSIDSANTWSLGQRSIATKGKNVYIVTGFADIMFTKSTDSGKTFKTPIHIGGGYNPSIALGKDGTIYAVSSAGDGGTAVMKSTDDGESFSSLTSVGGGYFANVTVDDNGDVYVACASYGDFSIFKSTDGGISFVGLNFPVGYYDSSPIIVAKGGVLHVSSGGGDGYVYYTKSTDGGATFDEKVMIPENPASGGPSLAVDNNSNVFITWVDRITVTEKNRSYVSENLYVATSKDKGNTFVIKKIDTRGDTPQSPSIAADAGGNVYLSWQVSQGTGTATFFTMSDTTGDTFLPPIRVSSGMYPTIAVNNAQDALIAWTADYKVYLSKSAHCTD